MNDYNQILFCIDEHGTLLKTQNIIGRQLPLEVRKKLNNVISTYLQWYSIDGVIERVDQRSVAQILDEFDPSLIRKPIEQGEVDGIKYQLFDPIEDDDE